MKSEMQISQLLSDFKWKDFYCRVCVVLTSSQSLQTGEANHSPQAIPIHTTESPGGTSSFGPQRVSVLGGHFVPGEYCTSSREVPYRICSDFDRSLVQTAPSRGEPARTDSECVEPKGAGDNASNVSPNTPTDASPSLQRSPVQQAQCVV